MAIVQVKQAAATAAAVTVTLTATTAGNTLIVLLEASGTSVNPTAFTVTLGGVAGNFVQDALFHNTSDASRGAAWRDQPCAGGQTSLVVTATGGSGTIVTFATVWECDDIAATPFDKTAGSGAASGTAWTSTATAATAQASERAFGSVFAVNPTTTTITGPSSPWVNQAQLSQAQGAGENAIWMAGTNDLSATGTPVYSGTFALGEQWDAAIATYKLGAAAAARIPDVAMAPMTGG